MKFLSGMDAVCKLLHVEVARKATNGNENIYIYIYIYIYI